MKPRYIIYVLFLYIMFIIPLRVSAEDSSSLNTRGLNELRSNNAVKAVELFLRAVSADPKQKHYHNNLAAAYMRLGEYAKAEEHLKRSLELDSNYARALSNMSVTLFHLGRYRESYKYYILTKESDKDYAAQRFDKKKVSSYIKKLSEGKPDDEDLKKIKAYIDSGE